MFLMLHTLYRAYVAAKCLASRAVGLYAKCTWLGGSLKGSSLTVSLVLGFLALSVTIEEKPSAVCRYQDLISIGLHLVQMMRIKIAFRVRLSLDISQLGLRQRSEEKGPQMASYSYG